MDICIPAFSPEGGYYTTQESSTIAMALECNVSNCSPRYIPRNEPNRQVKLPILATKRLREAYRYADDDRVLVTRPTAMSEIEAIRSLRLGDAGHFYRGLTTLDHSGALGLSKELKRDVDEMLRRGWIRTREEFEAFKRQLWKENERVSQKLLRGV